MFDLILGWAVVMLPFLFAIGVELVPKEERDSPYWKAGIVGFGLVLSALTWTQMARAVKVASKDRQDAIIETATRTSEIVNAKIKDNMVNALQDYNSAHPQNPITNEQFAEFTKNFNRKQSIGTLSPAQSKFASITNPMLSDIARVSVENLTEFAQQWEASEHNEYMKIWDPIYGIGEGDPRYKQIEQLKADATKRLAAKQAELAKEFTPEAKKLMLQANDCRHEILNRLLPEQKNYQDETIDTVFEKTLLERGDLVRAAAYLDALRKRLR
jgi:hypothetical protein